MRIKLTRIRKSRYVDCSLSDCMPDGYYEPGIVNVRTVDEFPVSELPQAELLQFGHETAYGWSSVSLKGAMRLFGVKEFDGLATGMEADVEPTGLKRNREMRKAGSFRFYL